MSDEHEMNGLADDLDEVQCRLATQPAIIMCGSYPHRLPKLG
jgi:hypothetical protein